MGNSVVDSAVLDDLRRMYPAGRDYPETSWAGAAFLRGLVSLFRPGLAVEIGCKNGASSAYICSALLEIGSGSFVGYELSPVDVAECTRRLDLVWPGGAWRVVHGDFFQTCEPTPADFVFLDIDPKTAYIAAYERCALHGQCVFVAHDATFVTGIDPVNQLRERLESDGFKTFLFEPERGFLVGVRS